MNAPHHTQARYAKHLATLAALSLGIAAQQASAADVTWVGNTSNLWNVGTNWSTSAIPSNGDTLVFGGAGYAGTLPSDNITGLTLGSSSTNGVVFGSSASLYTIGRSATQTITLGTSTSAGSIALKNTSSFLQTFNVPLVYSSDQTVQVGNTTGSAFSTLATGTGVWTNGFRLTKTGVGLLTLGSGNSLGGLTVNQGTVGIQSDGALSSVPPTVATPGWITLNGGTLRVNVGSNFALNANRGIALGDGTAGSGGTLNVYTSSSGTALTYNGAMTNNGGTNSFTKTGVLNLILGGANTYTGATKINQGQLTLDFTQTSAPTADIINSGSTLVLGGVPTSLVNTAAGNPILLLQGSNTAATTQTFNGTSIAQGYGSIVARGGTSTFDTTLALGALTHTAGGTVGFSLLTGGSTGSGIITTTTANTNGILGGWATTASAAGTGSVPLTQTDWARNDGNGNIVAYTGYTVTGTASGYGTTTAPTIANDGTKNLKIDATSTGNIVSFAGGVTPTDVNTIQGTDAAARIIAIGAGNILRLGNFGGVWKATGAGALTIGVSTGAGGTLTAGGSTDAAGEIVFNAGTAAITVNSVIADNGAGVVNVVKTGASGLTLNAANTFTGGMIINQGAVTATVAGAFGGVGKNVTVLPGGSISLATGGGLTYANNFNLAGSALSLGGTVTTSGGIMSVNAVGNTVGGTVTLLGDTTIGSSGTNGTISGKITGDYNLSFIGHTTLSNTTNDYTGNLGINGTAGPAGGNPVVLKLGANEVLANGAGKGIVIISGSGTSGNQVILDLNGKTETINGLATAETLGGVISAPGVGVLNSRVTNTSATAASLTLGDNNQSAIFNGSIYDGAGTISLTKIGAGIQTLGGANGYTGATTVNGGVLKQDFTTVGSSLTNAPSNYISGSSALNLGGGTLSIVGRANGSATSQTSTSASGLITIAVPSTAGLVVGQAVTGSGIPAGAYIAYMTGTTITLNTLTTGANTTVVTSAQTTTTSQSFANTTLNAGASGVSVNANGGGGTVLNLNAITRNNGSTLAVTLPSGTQSATNGVTTTSTTFLNNNVLASAAGGTAFATVGDNDWASLSGNNIVGLVAGGGSYTTTSVAGTTASNYTNGNIDVTSSEGLLSGVITPNTFRFNTTGANTVTLAAGNNVIGAGGILVTSAVGNNLSTITGGDVMGSTIGKDLVVIQNNTGNGLTIASNIVNNGTATSLTKSGAGLLTLSGTNTYTGSTYVNAGTLSVIGSLSSGSVGVSSGATLRGTGSIGGATTLASGSTLAAGVNASTIGSLTFTSTLDVTAATVSLKLNSTSGTFDSFIANGLTLGGATLSLVDLGSGVWTGASSFTILNNTSGNSVSGTFFGLTEGASLTVGSNNFTVSYLGGTGNDITLTVSAVPEPATYAALFGTLVLGVTVMHRRRSKKSL